MVFVGHKYAQVGWYIGRSDVPLSLSLIATSNKTISKAHIMHIRELLIDQ